MAGVAELSLSLQVTDDDGERLVAEERVTRWSGDGIRDSVALPAGAFTTLSPPSKAALLVLFPPPTASAWTLKGTSSDAGSTLLPASPTLRLPIVLSLGSLPTLGIRNDGPTCTVPALWVTSAAMPVPITDTFTRADSASLGTTETGGATWEVSAGHGWGISGNRAQYQSGFGNTIATVLTPWSDIDLSVSFPVIAGTLDGLAFRCSGDETGNGWIVAVDSPATWRLFRFVAGVATEVADTGITPQNNDVVRVTAIGSAITVSVNGVVRATTTSSFQQSGKRHGLAQRTGASYTGRWDSFSVGPLA